MPTQGQGKQPRSLTEQIEELRAKIALLGRCIERRYLGENVNSKERYVLSGVL